MHNNFSGIWHCRYWYPSNKHPGEQEISEYLVDMHQRHHKLTMTSLPTDDGSYMTVRLTIDDNLVTGAWYECTAPKKEFKGMIYSGAVQLIVSEDGKRMDGKWVGNGREKLDDGTYEQRIYTGKWELVRADKETTSKAMAKAKASR